MSCVVQKAMRVIILDKLCGSFHAVTPCHTVIEPRQQARRRSGEHFGYGAKEPTPRCLPSHEDQPLDKRLIELNPTTVLKTLFFVKFESLDLNIPTCTGKSS